MQFLLKYPTFSITKSLHCISINIMMYSYSINHRRCMTDISFSIHKKSTVCLEKIYESIILSYKKIFSNVVILFLISSDIVTSHLSIILPFGLILKSSHTHFISPLYSIFIEMYLSNDLLESNLNNIRTTKHHRIKVGKSTYDLPRLLVLFYCYCYYYYYYYY